MIQPAEGATAVMAARAADDVPPVFVVVEVVGAGFRMQPTDARGEPSGEPQIVAPSRALASIVRRFEQGRPRWVWDTATVYPALLAGGVRVRRAYDLRLARAILRRAAATAEHFRPVPPDAWDVAGGPMAPLHDALFDVESPTAPEVFGAIDEFRRQQQAVGAAAEPGRLRLLLAAESAGALVAAEIAHAGLPWSAAEHERILEQTLGPRVPYGTRPGALETLLEQIRDALGAPTLNPDSPADLIRALRRVGLAVQSTRSHELQLLEHPAIEPLLDYKKRSRLLTANGWYWLDTWVVDGRFRPDYLVGGVVTGRWATRGGGALQLPKQIRSAVVADPGWKLVVADAAQLEPRVLAGMAHDTAMASAGRGRDLYEGIVASGAVPDRSSAKYGMLGALYGATRGPGGRLVPRLAQRFPHALGMVERAARTGEQGGQVSTLLGRTSPAPSGERSMAFRQGQGPDGAEMSAERARAIGRDQGRFTRNFIVQGTAAEWALCWMADLRSRLAALGPGTFADGVLTEQPHLVYFLHDEVIVHTPAALADAAADAVRAAASAAGALLFGDFPIDFPLDVHIVDRYSDAD